MWWHGRASRTLHDMIWPSHKRQVTCLSQNDTHCILRVCRVLRAGEVRGSGPGAVTQRSSRLLGRLSRRLTCLRPAGWRLQETRWQWGLPGLGSGERSPSTQAQSFSEAEWEEPRSRRQRCCTIPLLCWERGLREVSCSGDHRSKVWETFVMGRRLRHTAHTQSVLLLPFPSPCTPGPLPMCRMSLFPL